MFASRRFGEALEYGHWKFPGPQGLRIGVGFVLTIRSPGYFLNQPIVRGYILAAFFGMIIDASVIVWKMIPRDSNTKRWT